jgi:hypothetical protein
MPVIAKLPPALVCSGSTRAEDLFWMDLKSSLLMPRHLVGSDLRQSKQETSHACSQKRKKERNQPWME